MLRFRVRLSLKFFFSLALVILVTALSLSFFFTYNQTRLIRTALQNKCGTLARNLAATSEFGVITRNKLYLFRLTESTLQEEDAVYSIIYDRNSQPLSSSEGYWKNGQFVTVQPPTPGWGISLTTLKPGRTISSSFTAKNGDRIYESICAITTRRGSSSREDIGFMDDRDSKREIIGAVRVGISLARMHQEISSLRKGAFLITLIVVGICIMIATSFVRIIVGPVRELVIGTNKIASGDLDYRVTPSSHDEIGELAASFNRMAGDLQSRGRELDREKEDLLRVKGALEERTRELEMTLLKMKSIQQELLRSEKFATIGRLAATVAHELRNPLASLKNISYYLMKLGCIEDERAKHMLNMLSSDVQRANKIVTDLMDYSRMKKLVKTPVRVDEFIDQVLDHHCLFESMGIIIVRRLEPFTATIDADRMTQVIMNLINNARDAMPSSGGTITITSCRTGDKQCEIVIQDTGNGMDEDTTAHLFEPLFTTKLKGLGLGLAIVKEIIDAHCGKIIVISEQGKGTTATMMLPL